MSKQKQKYNLFELIEAKYNLLHTALSDAGNNPRTLDADTKQIIMNAFREAAEQSTRSQIARYGDTISILGMMAVVAFSTYVPEFPYEAFMVAAGIGFASRAVCPRPLFVVNQNLFVNDQFYELKQGAGINPNAYGNRKVFQEASMLIDEVIAAKRPKGSSQAGTTSNLSHA